MQRAVDLGEPLDGRYLRAVALGGEDRAALYGRAVDMHDTGAALAGVAADMGACQAEALAQELHEQRARLDLGRDRLAVHGHGNGGHRWLPRAIAGRGPPGGSLRKRLQWRKFVPTERPRASTPRPLGCPAGRSVGSRHLPPAQPSPRMSTSRTTAPPAAQPPGPIPLRPTGSSLFPTWFRLLSSAAHALSQ